MKLAEARPTDAEVLRVLAESQAAQGKYAPSAASYRKAWEASGRGSLEILQGLSAALVADGKEAAAVAAVQEASAPGGSSGIGASELQLLAGKVFSQWRGHVPDAIAVYDALIEVRGRCLREGDGLGSGLEMVTGGLTDVGSQTAHSPHAPCSLPIFLPCPLQASPEDFRGYLAKGLLLKEQGREGERPCREGAHGRSSVCGWTACSRTDACRRRCSCSPRHMPSPPLLSCAPLHQATPRATSSRQSTTPRAPTGRWSTPSWTAGSDEALPCLPSSRRQRCCAEAGQPGQRRAAAA